MAYNKYVSLGTVKGSGIIAGEVLARKVKPDKYILFRLTYEDNPRIIGLVVPTTKQKLVFHKYLTKEEARKLK